MSPLAEATIRYAKGELGQRETSRNWSARIAEYLAVVAWKKPAPWCAAFACWCVFNAAAELGIVHALVFGLSTLKLWDRNKDARAVTSGPGVDLSGCLALRNEGACAGHTMIVESMNPDGTLHVISGNTYPGGNDPSREGICVAEHDIPLSQLAQGYGFIRIE